MPYCGKCNTMFSSRQSLWKHRKRRHQDPKDIAKRIIDKVIQKADKDTDKSMNVTPFVSKKPMNTVVPTTVKPKSVINLAMEFKEETDSEEPISSEDETEDEKGYEVMHDNLEDLKKACRDLYMKLHDNNKNYNKLVLMVDELRKRGCLTKEDCKTMNKHLQEKVGIL